MDESIRKVPLSQFLSLLQEVVNTKLDTSLQLLKKKFAYFFNVAKQIIHNLVMLHDLFGENCNFLHDEEWIDPKQLIHNSLHYLQLCFTEFPDYLSSDYCEHFLRYTLERINQIKANLHPLTHLQLDNKTVQKKLNNQLKQIHDGLRLLLTILPEIQEERIQQSLVLEQKQEIFNNFKSKIDLIGNSYNELKSNLTFLPYFTVYKAFYSPLNTSTSKVTTVQSLFTLLTNAINLQIKLQKMLEGPTRLAQILNQVGKKALRGQAQEIQQAMKYCLILNKPDYTLQTINKENLDDFVETIKFLDKQSFYLNITSIDNLWFDGNLFKSDWNQWDQINTDIITASNKQSVIQEWDNEKNKNQLINLEISQFVQQIFDFQNHMIHYFRLCSNFEKVHKEIQQEFLQKFNLTIKVECPDLNMQIQSI